MKQKKKKNERKKLDKKTIRDRTIRDLGTLFDREEEKAYYKPKRVSNFWNNNYIEYESNGDRNRNLSLDEYLNKFEPYLRNIKSVLQNSTT